MQVNFTVDIRAMHDEGREAIESEFSCQVNQICDVRMVNCTIERKVYNLILFHFLHARHSIY